MRFRFLLRWGVLLVILLLPLAAASFSLLGTLFDLGREVQRSVRRVHVTSQLEAAVFEAGRRGDECLVYRNTGASDAAIQTVDQRFDDALHGVFHTTAEQDMIESAHLEWERFKDIFRDMHEMDPAQMAAAAPDLAVRLDSQLSRVTDLLSQQYDANLAEIALQIDQTRLAGSRFMYLLLVCCGLLLAHVLHSAEHIHRYLLKPLRELEQKTRRMEQGDLSVRIDITGESEFGQVAHAFNSMAARSEVVMADLRTASTRDGLTGLLNRQEFETQLQCELNRADRYQRPLSLLFLDIDHFKCINDEFGHQAGDLVLREVAGRIRLGARSTDIAARCGGDEMAVILPETTAAHALALARRIHGYVRDTPIQADGREFHITVSIGIATYPRHGPTAKVLTATADQNLYQAKRTGRDQVCV
ncbi:MAG TPA: GGDEF domain-containing protein [Symbiobacteriaceae bacterium]